MRPTIAVSPSTGVRSASTQNGVRTATASSRASGRWWRAGEAAMEPSDHTTAAWRGEALRARLRPLLIVNPRVNLKLLVPSYRTRYLLIRKLFARLSEG